MAASLRPQCGARRMPVTHLLEPLGELAHVGSVWLRWRPSRRRAHAKRVPPLVLGGLEELC